METHTQPAGSGAGEGLDFTESDGTGINKNAHGGRTPGASDFEQKETLSMGNDSTHGNGRVGQDSADNKALNRIVSILREKLAGQPVTVKAPASDDFKRNGRFEVWGTIARQAGKIADAEATHAAIVEVLQDYEPETVAEVWGLLEPEPVILPVSIAGTIEESDSEADSYSTSNRPPDSDMARGLVLLPHFVGRVRWVQEWGSSGWLYWSGKRWERNAAACERLAKKVLPREIAANWGSYDAAADAAQKKNVENAVWWVRSHEQILTKPEDLDGDPWLLNLDNGTLNLKTMELQPHDPANLCTKIAPVAYDPAAKCPLFEATLKKFLRSESIRTFLLRHFGSCLTGIITHLKLPILYGQGRNGKSTITNAVAFVLGHDYTCTLDANVLTSDESRRTASDPTRLYHLASLHGKRFVVVNELDEGCTLRGPQLKSIVSTDKITGRRPKEMPFSFWPSHKVVMLTNHKPRLKSVEDGTMRRLALVPHNVQIEANEDDKHFGEKLKTEAAGILNLLVEGCKDWQNQGHDAPVPAEIAAATEEYRHDEDTIGRFVTACINKNSGGFITGKVAYDTYQAWCMQSGIEPASQTAFGKKFSALFEKSKQGVVKYNGIIIKTDWQKELK
jgi:putative DNA primase/helicase